MGDSKKSTRAGSVEKIFDRLTVMVVNHELMLNGTFGPLTPEQKAVLTAMIDRSKEIATLLREAMQDL